MKKNRIIITIIFFMLYFPFLVYGRFFVGAGPNYAIPLSRFSELNKSALGFNIQIEDRGYCNLWYGVRIDYNAFDSAANLKANDNYFDKCLVFSPEMRYVFNKCESYNNNFMPYIQGELNISSINGKDEKGNLGLGASAGAGVIYGFTLFKRCWSLDLNVLYSAPNCLIRADGRPPLQFMNVSLTLGFGL